MEIKLDQKVYPSGTTEVVCHYWNVSNTSVPQYLRIHLSKFRKTYILEVQEDNITTMNNNKIDVIVDSCVVENPKYLSIYDWQLLKILHPEVQYFQWEIFKTLKDLVDNRIEEWYTLAEIKLVLQQENKIES